LHKFLDVNERCRNWHLELNTSKEEMLFNLLKKELDDFFHPGGELLVNSYYDLLSNGRLGPGASLGALGYDFYTKLYSSVLTCTSSDLYNMYGDWLSWFPDWVDAEISRLLHFRSHEVVSSSRLRFVPKSTRISRTICVEPSLNMFYQLGLGKLIEERLTTAHGISLSTQPDRNRWLAKFGSLTDSISTIDLSSASDSMSLGMLREVLPEWVYDLLCTLRTPYTRLNEREIRLEMVSTMGNGFTFPLQTCLFSCLVKVCTKFHFGSADVWGNHTPLWGVFGDDIACHRDVTRDVIRMLEVLGFAVNADKTFVEGPFRESCGHDYFKGVNVRGVYVKTLKTMQDRYVAINLLTKWCDVHGIHLPGTLAYLASTVRRVIVPLHEQDDSGIKVPLSVAGSRFDRGRQAFLYACYTVVPRFLLVKSDRISVPFGQKHRHYNPHGLLLSMLHGSVVDGKIGTRLRSVKYRRITRSTHNWDWSDDGRPGKPGGSVRRWCDTTLYQPLLEGATLG
jgi:hypothetical protein